MQLLSALSGAPKDESSGPKDAPSGGDVWDDNGEEDMGVTLVKKGEGTRQHTVEQLEGALYAHPRIYDWAFGYRDYEQEVRQTATHSAAALPCSLFLACPERRHAG